MQVYRPYQIMQADESHVDFLADFGQSAFIDAYKGTLPFKNLKEYTDTAFSKSKIIAELNNASVTYFVCKGLESELCGYSKLTQSFPPHSVDSDHTIELQRLYIAKNHQGKGMGKLLHGCTESHARNKGFSSIWLRVWDGNLLAQMQYLKWDYVVAGKEQFQVGDDSRTVILMRKPFL